MHGELVEFNERLQKIIKLREEQVSIQSKFREKFLLLFISKILNIFYVSIEIIGPVSESDMPIND